MNSISAEIKARRAERLAAAATGKPAPPAFLIFDTESIPDGDLIARVKYPRELLTPTAAVERARTEAREASKDGSDFLPVTFQIPVAVCVVRVARDFTLEGVACLDAPLFRTPEIVRAFWKGVGAYPGAKLVTFNGRGFDLPLMELAAFDYGCDARNYFTNSRNRFQGNHIDLMDWLSNYGACRITGGLSMLAQRRGGGRQPGCGKMDVAGDQVYDMYCRGELQQINDYCMFDTLDTYFVFLRTRVLIGEMTSEIEAMIAKKARDVLEAKATGLPALASYLETWDRLRS